MMSRPEPPHEAADRWLRAALAEASRRTGDEMARRRTWSRIAHPAPVLSRPWWPRVLVGLVLLSGAAGAWLVWPRPHTHQVTSTGVAGSTEGHDPAATSPGMPAEARSHLAGPTEVRTGDSEEAMYVMQGGAEVDLGPNSELQLDPTDRPTLRRGRVSLVVPRQPPGHRFRVRAANYEIVVLGTRFHVRVAGERVGVDVDEGVVEVRRNGRLVRRLAEGAWWTSDAEPESVPRSDSRPKPSTSARPGRRVSALAAPAAEGAESGAPSTRPAADVARARFSADVPAARLAGGSSVPAPSTSPVEPSPSRDPFQEARDALAAGQPERAVTLLRELSRGQGPAAENAAYEMGRVLRTELLRPRDAIRTWRWYRDRFPRGLLRAEVDLSILETLVALADNEAALDEAEAFLARHPRSERGTEVRHLIQQLRTPEANAAP